MASPRPGRWLAPSALAAAVIAVVVVVAAGGGGSHSSPSTAPATTVDTARTTTRSAAGHGAPATRTYVIQPGDNLSSVAQKTGVPLARIEQLNPGVNPQSLHAGQRIRLPGGGR